MRMIIQELNYGLFSQAELSYGYDDLGYNAQVNELHLWSFYDAFVIFTATAVP